MNCEIMIRTRWFTCVKVIKKKNKICGRRVWTTTGTIHCWTLPPPHTHLSWDNSNLDSSKFSVVGSCLRVNFHGWNCLEGVEVAEGLLFRWELPMTCGRFNQYFKVSLGDFLFH